ncbi:hypothetical protein [Methanorbis rubei]|uniref:Antitoxin n=1 Tax=Methanorbis rubei TaxID=3028300 RepID=A0AAE4MHK2_9EURY|nr:hypothetical protein [Methanocorpusculaceae archaeon Cs1]
MQAMEPEQKKSVMVSADVHRRIVALRKGDQTYGDVVAASIRVLEEREEISSLPCVDDFSEEEIDQMFREAQEHPEEFCTLEEFMKKQEEIRRKK